MEKAPDEVLKSVVVASWWVEEASEAGLVAGKLR